MPTYVYLCHDCKHEFEEMQKISASPLVTCPKCNKDALKRKPSGGAGLSFSGSGFYSTDYESPPKQGGCCPCGKNKGHCSS